MQESTNPVETSSLSTTPTIGIWGPTEAGKTTYLSGLHFALSTFAQEWKIWPGENDYNAERFIETNTANLHKGFFPPPTEVADHKTYSFRLFRKDSFLGLNGRYHEIRMIDAAGGLILNSQYTPDYFEALSQCKGILLMIDPDVSYESGLPGPMTTSEAYSDLLQRLMNYLSKKCLNKVGSLDMNVAFCLTKIDQDKHWPKRNNPKAYLKQILGQPTFNIITNVFDPERIEFFAISVVGRYQTASGDQRPNIVPEGDRYRIADLSQWQPYNMLDPLLWLFDRIEIERDSRLMWWRSWLRRLVRTPNYRNRPTSSLPIKAKQNHKVRLP